MGVVSLLHESINNDGLVARHGDLVVDLRHWRWLRGCRVRRQSTDRSVVRDATAFLVTTTVRLAISVAHSARLRRETYIGPWLPEPIDTTADPTLGAERAEALELAVLILLENLSPNERASYVLREAFDYSYSDIADILQLTEANTRQLVTRARKHIANGRRAQVSPAEHRRFLAEDIERCEQINERFGLLATVDLPRRGESPSHRPSSSD